MIPPDLKERGYDGGLSACHHPESKEKHMNIGADEGEYFGGTVLVQYEPWVKLCSSSMCVTQENVR